VKELDPMRNFMLILIVLVLIGGVLAYRNGFIRMSTTTDKTTVEVNTGEIKKELKDAANRIDDFVSP